MSSTCGAEYDFMYLHLFLIGLLSYCHFDDSIPLLLKKFVGFSNPRQRETVRDERCGIYLALLDELQDFFAVTAIHTTCLEGEILDAQKPVASVEYIGEVITRPRQSNLA